MSSKTFLPDYASQRVGRVFHALYRFFEDEEWRHVCADGSPEPFPTAIAAREAAKECLRTALNPAISCHRSARKAVIDAAEEFFQTKHEKRSREHTARKRGVRDVVFVETKVRRPKMSKEETA